MMFVFQLQEINTNDDIKVEFNDDKNQLIWFLQPQEAQFYLAAETLKRKPHTFVRTKLPFKPRRTSRVTRPKWPQIYEFHEYLSRLRASEVGVEGKSPWWQFSCYLICETIITRHKRTQAKWLHCVRRLESSSRTQLNVQEDWVEALSREKIRFLVGRNGRQSIKPGTWNIPEHSGTANNYDNYGGLFKVIP